MAMEFLMQLSKATFGTFSKVMARSYEIQPSVYWKVLWETGFPFTYNVSNSNTQAYNRTEMNQVVTEVGLCYSYNSLATIYYDPRIWERNEWHVLSQTEIFRSNPLDGDIFAQVMNMNAGYRLYVLDPTEFPDISIPQLEGLNNSYKTLDLTALSIVSTKEVEELSIQQRKCRLPRESNLLSSPVYSYNLCRIECRMKECYRLCKCIPHFYRSNDNYPVCDLEGMHCLDKHSERLVRMIDPNTGVKVPCHCLQLCNEVNYVVDTENSMAWTLGTNLKWGLTKYPKFRLKRGILFGGTELLVAIGGTAGLFFGCSLLSLAEIVYFFTLHLFWFIMKRNKNCHVLRPKASNVCSI
nr:pickpocket protein 11-like [Halyomorpha halys]